MLFRSLTLAEAGRSVILVEAGPAPERLGRDTASTLATYFADGGMRALRGTAPTPTLQARALGGGSVFNSAICMRPYVGTFERWAQEHRVSLTVDEELAWVEAFYGVAPTPDEALGARAARFRDGCERLGWSVEALPRMVAGCRGSGQCLVGCTAGAKRSADRRGVPELLAAGGRVYTHAEVERIVLRGGRARGVEGLVEGGTFRIRAEAVVLAAGVMASPVLLQRSGLDRGGVGDRLQLHPSAFSMALYDAPVEPWTGATQGLHSLAHMDRSIKLEDLWVPHGILAVRLPGGAELSRWLQRTRPMGVFATWVTTSASFGQVRALPGGLVDRTYELAPTDLARLQDGIVHLAELAFAGGATRFFHGIEGLAPLRRDELDRLRGLNL